MNEDLQKINEEVTSIEDEYGERFFDIPFENSMFQNRNFVANIQQTPERAYRALGLRVRNKINALREAYYDGRVDQIEIEELEQKLETLRDNGDHFGVRKTEVEILRRQHRKRDADKLINDAITDVRHLMSLVRQFPKYTREDFEKAERGHFKLKLERQALGIVGAAESLDAMGEDITKQLDLKGSSNRGLLVNENDKLSEDPKQLMDQQ